MTIITMVWMFPAFFWRGFPDPKPNLEWLPHGLVTCHSSLPFNYAILHKFAKERMEKNNRELQYILASTLIFPKMGKLLKIPIITG